MDKVRVHKDANGDWMWSRESSNGEPLSRSTEGYENKAHAVEMANDKNGGDFEVVIEDSE